MFWKTTTVTGYDLQLHLKNKIVHAQKRFALPVSFTGS